jgi:hypothetical protein
VDVAAQGIDALCALQAIALDGVGAVIPDFTSGEGPGETSMTDLLPTELASESSPRRLSEELSELSRRVRRL